RELAARCYGGQDGVRAARRRRAGQPHLVRPRHRTVLRQDHLRHHPDDRLPDGGLHRAQARPARHHRRHPGGQGALTAAMTDAPPPPAWSPPPQVAGGAPGLPGPPAGFWIRFLAYLVDGFILMLALGLLGGIVVGLVIAAGGASGKDADAAIL